MSLADSLFLLTRNQRDEAEDILLIIRYIFFALALPATVCNLVVFLQRDMRSATSTYVIGLSLAQLLYIVTSIVGRILAEVIENPLNDLFYLIYSVYISSYLSIVVRRSSYLVMCLVSLERLYAVIRPFHIKEFVLSKYPAAIMSATYISVALWHVYMLTKTSVVQVVSKTAAPILMTYIGLTALITLNVLTIWALRRHNVATKDVQSSASEEAKRKRERQMTVTILAYTVIYVLLSLPYAIHNICKSLFVEYDKREKYENMYYVMRSCAFNLTLLSCAVDFVCFFVLSSNYRKTLTRLTGMRRKRLQGMAQSGDSQTIDTEVNSNVSDKF
nr:hypothetical protein BaRGS_022485 [Batillaria attramentaria]